MGHVHPLSRSALLQGAVAAAVTLGLASLLAPDHRLDLLAALLALTGGIYMGFGFLDGRPRVVGTEVAAGLAFTAVALAGAWWSPLLLAAGWLAHTGWDLLHHTPLVPTRIAGWVPPFCLVYDVAVAAAIVAWYPPW